MAICGDDLFPLMKIMKLIARMMKSRILFVLY